MIEQTLYPAFQAVVRRHADRVAIEDDGVALTYQELEAESRCVARALMAAGVDKGDRVLIWSVNRLEWVLAGLGIQASAGVLLLASTRLKASEVARILNRAQVRVLICDPGFGDYDFVEGLKSEHVPSLERIVVLDDRAADGTAMGWTAFLRQGEACTDAELDARIASVAPDDIADIIFTSGTTGEPKGVPITHAQSLIACAQQQACVTTLQPQDVFGVIYPFAHNAGYRAGWQAGLLSGVKIIPIRTYDPAELMALIERVGVTVLPAAPPIFQAMLDHEARSKYDLSSLRYAGTGATTIPVRLIERMFDELGAAQVGTGYGLTEAAGSVSNTQPGDSPAIIATTTGRVLANLEVKLLDREGRQVPVGEPGEIAVRGPQVMTGYYEDPEATHEAFTSDGFLKTGDVGVFDAMGNLSITDRIKDMYIVGGFNCYPAEIEQQLGRLEGVRQVAVIGVADGRLGQVGRACIVKSAGSELDEARVIAWCRDQMANYKVPRSVEFIDQLPLNATGKIDKRVLRERAAGRSPE